MQINSALSSTASGPGNSVVVSKDATKKSPAAGNDASIQTDSKPDTSTQDSAVHISAQGAATAAQEARTGQGGEAASDPVADDASATNVSAAKSFAYGTLGLERPDQPQEKRNAFYTAGRWLAAGITIGGIISLLA